MVIIINMPWTGKLFIVELFFDYLSYVFFAFTIIVNVLLGQLVLLFYKLLGLFAIIIFEPSF